MNGRFKENRMKDDKMANTKVDPYQDPAYHPPHHEPHPVVETRTTEQPHIAPEKQAENENVKAENNRDKGVSLNR